MNIPNFSQLGVQQIAIIETLIMLEAAGFDSVNSKKLSIAYGNKEKNITASLARLRNRRLVTGGNYYGTMVEITLTKWDRSRLVERPRAELFAAAYTDDIGQFRAVRERSYPDFSIIPKMRIAERDTLQMAAVGNSHQIAGYLIDCGMPINQTDRYRPSATWIAMDLHHDAVALELLSRGGISLIGEWKVDGAAVLCPNCHGTMTEFMGSGPLSCTSCGNEEER